MIGLWLLKRRVDGVQDKIDAARSLMAGGLPSVSPVPPVDTVPPPPAVSAPGAAPPGDIVTRYGNPPRDVADAIKRYWPQSQWVNAATVSFLESGWSNTAELNTLNRGPCGTRYFFSAEVGWATTEQSVGIFQINVCAHGGTREFWHDPDNNARKAAELFASSGWSPWIVSARRAGLLQRGNNA